jgi:hypothetical protein
MGVQEIERVMQECGAYEKPLAVGMVIAMQLWTKYGGEGVGLYDFVRDCQRIERFIPIFGGVKETLQAFLSGDSSISCIQEVRWANANRDNVMAVFFPGMETDAADELVGRFVGRSISREAQGRGSKLPTLEEILEARAEYQRKLLIKQ